VTASPSTPTKEKSFSGCFMERVVLNGDVGGRNEDRGRVAKIVIGIFTLLFRSIRSESR
jgi:hypothetical protein